MTDTFERNLMISLGAHALVALIIFVRAALVPSDPIIIRKAIRVDVVGLPQKMVEAKLPPPAPPEAKPVPAKPAAEPVKTPAKTESKPKAPTVNLDKTKKADTTKAQDKALARIKQMSALEKIQEELKQQKPNNKPTAVAGNQISEGNSLEGLARIDYDRYLSDLESRVRASWSLPQWLADQPLKAQIQIFIDARGYVTKKVMRRSSGNEIFDAKVIEAIDANSPLPEPPANLRGALATSGIILNFPE